MTRDELIAHFKMTRHPKGGAFVETYRSDLKVSAEGFRGPRAASTGIYFLLGRGEFSGFHRIKSDEMWHSYLGGPLHIVEIDSETSAAPQHPLHPALATAQMAAHLTKRH